MCTMFSAIKSCRSPTAVPISTPSPFMSRLYASVHVEVVTVSEPLNAQREEASMNTIISPTVPKQKIHEIGSKGSRKNL